MLCEGKAHATSTFPIGMGKRIHPDVLMLRVTSPPRRMHVSKAQTATFFFIACVVEAMLAELNAKYTVNAKTRTTVGRTKDFITKDVMMCDTIIRVLSSIPSRLNFLLA